MQQGLRISLFAPNLTLTTGKMLKTYGIDIFAKGTKGRLSREATIRMILYSQIILQGLSYGLNGHSSFENEDKKKILALKIPGFKDEKGNQYYINPLGWIIKPIDLVMRPLESIFNKISLLPRFAFNLLSSPYKFEKQAESRISNAIDGIIPIPFALQSILRFGLAQFQEKSQYGVSDDFMEQMMISTLEFFGFEGVFTSGKAKTTVLTDLPEQVKKIFDNPENWKIYLDPIYIENYLLSKDLPTPKDIIKRKYNIEGAITDDENIEKLKKMPRERFELFISQYTEKTIETINKKMEDKINRLDYLKRLEHIQNLKK